MDTMDTMGRHVIAELWDCDFDKLNDMRILNNYLWMQH